MLQDLPALHQSAICLSEIYKYLKLSSVANHSSNVLKTLNLTVQFNVFIMSILVCFYNTSFALEQL